MTAPYTISDARYAKGQKVIHVNDSRGGMKGRASWLAEAVGGRWVNRSKGYHVSPAAAIKFEKLYAANFDSGFGYVPGRVLCVTEGREIPLTVNKAIEIIDGILFEASCVEVDPTRAIEQCTILVARTDMEFQPDGKGKRITIKARERVWVTNTMQHQRRVGAVVINRKGKGQIGEGWGFTPGHIAAFFTIEPNRQPEALAA